MTEQVYGWSVYYVIVLVNVYKLTGEFVCIFGGQKYRRNSARFFKKEEERERWLRAIKGPKRERMSEVGHPMVRPGTIALG